MTKLICEVCKTNEAFGVASSSFGPISHAYCLECLQAGREVYSTIVAIMYANIPDDATVEEFKDAVDSTFHPIIEATLTFYNKSWDELLNDCKEAWQDYLKFLSTGILNKMEG